MERVSGKLRLAILNLVADGKGDEPVMVAFIDGTVTSTPKQMLRWKEVPPRTPCAGPPRYTATEIALVIYDEWDFRTSCEYDGPMPKLETNDTLVGGK